MRTERVADELAWGDALCNLCRVTAAECVLEEEPLCIACADLVLERLCLAGSLPREVAGTLPDLPAMVGRGR